MFCACESMPTQVRSMAPVKFDPESMPTRSRKHTHASEEHGTGSVWCKSRCAFAAERLFLVAPDFQSGVKRSQPKPNRGAMASVSKPIGSVLISCSREPVEPHAPSRFGPLEGSDASHPGREALCIAALEFSRGNEPVCTTRDGCRRSATRRFGVVGYPRLKSLGLMEIAALRQVFVGLHVCEVELSTWRCPCECVGKQHLKRLAQKTCPRK